MSTVGILCASSPAERSLLMEQSPSKRLEELIRERGRLDVELEACKELVTDCSWILSGPRAFTTNGETLPA
jgi:hypothetical protein